MISNAFARLGLAARIGVAIGAAVAAIQALVTLVFVLNPPSLHPFYSARWLSGAVAEIIRNAETVERSRRAVWEICRGLNPLPFALHCAASSRS